MATDKLINLTFSDENIALVSDQNQLLSMYTLFEKKFNYDDSLLQYVIRNYKKFNINIVYNIIHNTDNIDYKNANGETALLIFLKYDIIFTDINPKVITRLDIINAFIDAGANTYVKDSKGITVLMTAAQYASKPSGVEVLSAIIENLKKNDKSIDTVCNYSTAIMLAAQYSSTTSTLDAVKVLMDAGASSIGPEPTHSYYIVNKNIMHQNIYKLLSVLEVAVRYSSTTSSLDTVKELIAHKPKEDILNRALITGLRYSSETSNLECIDLLINAGADVNYISDSNICALVYIIAYVPQSSKLDLIRQFIKAGANINAVCKYNSSVLMQAMCYVNNDGFIDIVRFLLNEGANLNHKRINGVTAIMEAAKYARTKSAINVIEYLISCGANPYENNNSYVDNIYHRYNSVLQELTLKYKFNKEVYESATLLVAKLKAQQAASHPCQIL